MYCKKDISTGCGALSDLKSHSTSGAHKNNAKHQKTNELLSAFYKPKGDGLEGNSVRAAEVAIVYHTVKQSVIQ